MEQNKPKKQNKQKRERSGPERLARMYAGIVIGALALGGVLLLVLPQKKYSPSENRYLTKRPKITAEGIFSGEVQRDLTEAASDQFPLRDRWMQIATTSQFLLFHREINGVYIGRDHTLFNKVTDSDLSEKNYRANLGYVTAMAAETTGDVSVMLVPSPATLQQEKLPTHGVIYDSEPYETLGVSLCEADSVRFVQTSGELARHLRKNEKLYFSTDHHWTTNGAYIGASVYLGAQDRSIAPQADFGVETVREDFYGTIYSKVAGLGLIRPEALALPLALPEGLTIETDGPPADAPGVNGEKSMPKLTGIYDESKLDGKDKYAVYFGGNYGRLTIKNPSAGEGGSLLMFKDSFANSMVPYLLDNYAQITMIDLRYYNESVPALVSEGWDEILICYEMSNFINDRNLVKLIR